MVFPNNCRPCICLHVSFLMNLLPFWKNIRWYFTGNLTTRRKEPATKLHFSMPRPPPRGPSERPQAIRSIRSIPDPLIHSSSICKQTESATPVPQHREVVMVLALETSFLQVLLEHCLNCCYNLTVHSEDLRLKGLVHHQCLP